MTGWTATAQHHQEACNKYPPIISLICLSCDGEMRLIERRVTMSQLYQADTISHNSLPQRTRGQGEHSTTHINTNMFHILLTDCVIILTL